RREHGVALRHAVDRLGELRAGDRLRHIAACTRANDADHILGGVRHRQREEAHAGTLGCNRSDHRLAAAVREVDVQQHDIRVELLDQRDRLLDARGLPDEVDGVAELGAHAGPEEAVVVDQDDAAPHDAPRGSVSSTSVPSPGAVVTSAVPPTRAMRPSIDSATPRRSCATAARSNPEPRSRTYTATRPSSVSANTEISSAPENLAAFAIASRAASTTARTSSSSVTSPVVARSIRTPCRSSTSAAEAVSAETSVSSPVAAPWPYSQSRSSRSWRRASDATRFGSSACFWISASDCRTESCTRAATSSRSSVLIRAVRSASRSTPSCHNQGPPTRRRAAPTAPGASSPPEVPPRRSRIAAPSATRTAPAIENGASGRSDPP